MAREVKQVTFTKAAIPKLTRVAAYARVSSAKDAMHHSLSAQVSYYSGLIQNFPGVPFRQGYRFHRKRPECGRREDPVRKRMEQGRHFTHPAQLRLHRKPAPSEDFPGKPPDEKDRGQ